MLLERSERANSDVAAGVVNGRIDYFSGRVDERFRNLLAKFGPQEVTWVPGGSGPLPLSLIYPTDVEGRF
jgi:hypothetical protein